MVWIQGAGGLVVALVPVLVVPVSTATTVVPALVASLVATPVATLVAAAPVTTPVAAPVAILLLLVAILVAILLLLVAPPLLCWTGSRVENKTGSGEKERLDSNHTCCCQATSLDQTRTRHGWADARVCEQECVCTCVYLCARRKHQMRGQPDYEMRKSR